MSLEQEVVDAFDAEKKFWSTPELAEKLLAHLDLASIKALARCHRLTRQILGKPSCWNKLSNKTLEGEDFILNSYTMPKEDDMHLAVMRPKIKLLSQILNLAESVNVFTCPAVRFTVACEKPSTVISILHSWCQMLK